MDDDDLGRLSHGTLHTLAGQPREDEEEIPLFNRKSSRLTSGANFSTSRDFPLLRAR